MKTRKSSAKFMALFLSFLMVLNLTPLAAAGVAFEEKASFDHAYRHMSFALEAEVETQQILDDAFSAYVFYWGEGNNTIDLAIRLPLSEFTSLVLVRSDAPDIQTVEDYRNGNGAVVKDFPVMCYNGIASIVFDSWYGGWSGVDIPLGEILGYSIYGKDSAEGIIEPGTYYFNCFVSNEFDELAAYQMIEVKVFGDDVDISNDFTDPNFRAAVYDIIGKDQSEPIYSSDVSGITYLNVSDKHIASLDGIEYFVNMTMLSCNRNQLTELPTLPAMLNWLDCSFNQITVLPELPFDLTYLFCYNNYLTELPALPSNLTQLDCYSNQLIELPELPLGLNILYCSSNQLTELPELPTTLETLDCSNNPISSLPSLPEGLRILGCAFMSLNDLYSTGLLSSLPELPSTLKVLDFNDNLISELPRLPEGLEELRCESNLLTELPELPLGLRIFNCNANRLSELPELPASLTYLDCSSNQLTGLNLTGLIALEQLRCYYNNLNELDLTGLTALQMLDCNRTNLKELDLTEVTALQELRCGNNNLTELNLTMLTALRELYCYNNSLTSLDLSSQTVLRELEWTVQIQDNPLEYLKLYGGYEMIIGKYPTDGGTVMLTGFNNKTKMTALTATPASGASFQEWTYSGFDSAPNTIKNTITFTLPVNPVTVTANFSGMIVEPEFHTVTFDYNDGVTPVVEIEVEDGQTVGKPVDPERDGYVFVGWFLEDEEFDFETVITGGITLTAHWEMDFVPRTFSKEASSVTYVPGGEMVYTISFTMPENVSMSELDNLYIIDNYDRSKMSYRGNSAVLRVNRQELTPMADYIMMDNKAAGTLTVSLTPSGLWKIMDQSYIELSLIFDVAENASGILSNHAYALINSNLGFGDMAEADRSDFRIETGRAAYVPGCAINYSISFTKPGISSNYYSGLPSYFDIFSLQIVDEYDAERLTYRANSAVLTINDVTLTVLQDYTLSTTPEGILTVNLTQSGLDKFYGVKPTIKLSLIFDVAEDASGLIASKGSVIYNDKPGGDGINQIEQSSDLGHIEGPGVVVTEATCEVDGHIAYYCTECGKELRTEPIPVLEHIEDEGTVTKAATCAEEGVMTYSCTVCGEIVRTEFITKDPVNHVGETYEAVITAATFTAEGLMGIYCSGCDVLLDTRVIPMLQNTFTVTFNSSGGSAVAPQQVQPGGLVVKPADPTRNGYEFLGWYYIYDDNDFAFNFNTMRINWHVTLTAKWAQVKPVFTVSFDSAGGSAVAPQKVEAGGLVVKPADPTRNGYEFLGWYYIYEDNDFAFNFNTMRINWNVTLTAKWVQVKPVFTVSFDSAGGSAVVPQKVEAGGLVVKPADPTRNGYEFLGWYYIYEDNDFAFNFNTMRINWHVTLTAKWNLAPVQPPDPLVSITADAFVTVIPGMQNQLWITVVVKCFDDMGITSLALLELFMIDNDAEGIYEVGGYLVYVDTMDDQILACYIIE